MTRDSKYIYWLENKEWYKLLDDGKIILTNKAPEKAKESFKQWCKLNGFKW